MMYTIYRLSDGTIVGHVSCSPKHLAKNVPHGCEAREGRQDPPALPIDLSVHVRVLAQEEISRLETQKVRALTDHVLAPTVEIDVRGKKMLPKDRVAELEAAIVEQRKRL